MADGSVEKIETEQVSQNAELSEYVHKEPPKTFLEAQADLSLMEDVVDSGDPEKVSEFQMPPDQVEGLGFLFIPCKF